MEKKKLNNVDSDDISELVLFGDSSPQEIKKRETISLEYEDQEDMIKIICVLEPFGANFLYSLLIANQSRAPITEVKIRIRFPDYLILIRSTPPTLTLDTLDIEEYEKQVKIEFEELKGISQKQINLYLCPVLLEEKGEIKSFVTFVNNADFVRALDSEPVQINFDPFTIERKILPTAEVKKFIEDPTIKKGKRSIGLAIDKPFDINYFFNQITKIIESQNFQLIAKDKNSKLAWFFGTELVSGNDILILAQITSGKIEWSAASENPHILITILTNFINQFKEEMILLGIIKSTEQIYNLECKYCGTTLPYFPQKGKSIECSKCNYEQIVWK
jgi:hypothetical protein